MPKTDQELWETTADDLAELEAFVRENGRVEFSRGSVFHASLSHFVKLAASGRVKVLAECEVVDVALARRVLAVSANVSKGPGHYGDTTAAAAIVLEAKLDEVIREIRKLGPPR